MLAQGFDFQDLILQGGSLAVILACFLAVLYWLLGHFTNALKRIEHAQYAMMHTLLSVTKAQLHSNFRLMGLEEEDKESKAVAMYRDLLTTIRDAVESIKECQKSLETIK